MSTEPAAAHRPPYLHSSIPLHTSHSGWLSRRALVGNAPWFATKELCGLDRQLFLRRRSTGTRPIWPVPSSAIELGSGVVVTPPPLNPEPVNGFETLGGQNLESIPFDVAGILDCHHSRLLRPPVAGVPQVLLPSGVAPASGSGDRPCGVPPRAGSVASQQVWRSANRAMVRSIPHFMPYRSDGPYTGTHEGVRGLSDGLTSCLLPLWKRGQCSSLSLCVVGSLGAGVSALSSTWPTE